MRTIEITDEEYTDRIAVESVKGKNPPNEEITPLYFDLLDVHRAMYPLHDILMKTENVELKAYLAEVILRLNGIRARLKNDKRSYA